MERIYCWFYAVLHFSISSLVFGSGFAETAEEDNWCVLLLQAMRVYFFYFRFSIYLEVEAGGRAGGALRLLKDNRDKGVLFSTQIISNLTKT